MTKPEEFERFAENLFNRFGRNINDRKTYDKAFDTYMEGELITEQQDTALRDTAWDILRKRVSRLKVYEDAGGKDFKRDANRKARTIVNTKKEYIKSGAKNVDLKDFDLPSKRGDSSNLLGFIKGRSVPVKEYLTNTKSGKRILRYRDKYGRLASKRH